MQIRQNSVIDCNSIKKKKKKERSLKEASSSPMNDLNGKNMNCEFTQICIDFHRFITYTNSVTLED